MPWIRFGGCHGAENYLFIDDFNAQSEPWAPPLAQQR
jgi:hypothetical protein